MVACCKAKFLFYPVSLNLLVAIKTFIPKGAIRIRKLKDRQHNGQKKKDNTACPFTLCRGFFYHQNCRDFLYAGDKVKEKTAIVPHCIPSFQTQWAPCNRMSNDLQNTTEKTKDRATRTPLKTGGDLMCSGRVNWFLSLV